MVDTPLKGTQPGEDPAGLPEWASRNSQGQPFRLCSSVFVLLQVLCFLRLSGLWTTNVLFLLVAAMTGNLALQSNALEISFSWKTDIYFLLRDSTGIISPGFPYLFLA